MHRLFTTTRSPKLVSAPPSGSNRKERLHKDRGLTCDGPTFVILSNRVCPWFGRCGSSSGGFRKQQHSLRGNRVDRLNFANKTRNVAVGTVKKSIETRSWIWLFKNAFQVGDGGVSRLGMSRETVRSEMLIPNLSSSPWIRGAPHRGLASAIFR